MITRPRNNKTLIFETTDLKYLNPDDGDVVEIYPHKKDCPSLNKSSR